MTNLANLISINAVQANLNQEKESWQRILLKYPDYRDGFLTLANIEYQLKDKQEALDLVLKALKIDPNYAPALRFEEFLSKN